MAAPNPPFAIFTVERVCLTRASRTYQPACKPGSVGHRVPAHTIRDGHSSGATFARRLLRPTRTAGPTRPCDVIAEANLSRCCPYSVLLPVGFTMPSPLPKMRCALTAPFHPCLPRREGGSFSVALSLGRPRRMLSGTACRWSPDFPLPEAFRPERERPSGRLTRYA